MVTDEQWLPVHGTPGYEASSLGRVRSLDRTLVNRLGVRSRRRGRVLSLSEGGSTPYLHVRVGGVMRSVHVLVAEAFHGPRPQGLVACHNNGAQTDNRSLNLRWGTPSDNMHDAVRHGALWQVQRQACPFGHELVAPNLTPGTAGRRACKACHRARSSCAYALRKQGVRLAFHAVADEKYRRILLAAAS